MVATHLVSASDLEQLEGDGFRYELIAGELVRMTPAKAKHGYVESEFLYQLKLFVRPRELGEVFGSSPGYRFGHDPDTVLAPDVSFVRRDRLPRGGEWEEFLQVVPDLVVEVLSPSERVSHIRRKVGIYLEAGVRLVLLVDTKTRSMTVHSPIKNAIVLTESDVFDGEDVIPGFNLAVGDLFRPLKP